jgi:hypothetical protein
LKRQACLLCELFPGMVTPTRQRPALAFARELTVVVLPERVTAVMRTLPILIDAWPRSHHGAPVNFSAVYGYCGSGDPNLTGVP